MTTKIRLTATAQEVENWKAFFNLLAQASVIQLLEVSDNYSNRDNSQYQRAYLEADLRVDFSSVEGVMLLEGREDA